MMKQKLHGVIPAILTPLNENGNLNVPMLEKQTEYLSKSGASGFFTGGTTAEGAYLNTEMRKQILRTVKSVSAGRQFLCAALINPSTNQSVDELRILAEIGPDYFVAVTPFYGEKDQGVILEHFETLADISPVPLILYNIPGRTQSPMTVDTVLYLSKHPNIAGIKDSSGDFIFFSSGFLNTKKENFTWIIGVDLLEAAAVMFGCRCIVTGLGNVKIEHYIDLFAAAERNDYEKIRKCQIRINAYQKILQAVPPSKINAAVKAATAFFGRSTSRMVMPAMGLTQEEQLHVESILRHIQG